MAANSATYNLSIGTNPIVTGTLTVTSTINSSGTVTFSCTCKINALSSPNYWNYGIKVQARTTKYDPDAAAWESYSSWGNRTIIAENTPTWSATSTTFTRTVTNCTSATNARLQVRLSYVDSSIGVVGDAVTYTPDVVALVVAAGDNVTAVSKSPNQTYHIDGDSITVNCTLASATGYTITFNKWTSNNTGSIPNSTSKKYTFNIADAETVTLTASATKTANTYTVAYNANGGSGSMASETFTYGVQQAITPNTFTRTGYTFNGWQAYRHSDQKWAYGKGGTLTGQGWYKEGEEPEGHLKINYANTLKWTHGSAVNGDTITLYAQWKINCYVYIDNSTSFDKYLAYIDNGTSWDLYAPYIDNGSSWEPYG